MWWLDWIRLLLCIGCTFSPGTDESPLRSVMAQYVVESSNLSPNRQKEFYEFWESQFQSALAASPELCAERLRMLDELGAIQKTRAKPKEAAVTFAQMAKEARELNNQDSLVLALDNGFELASHNSRDEAKVVGEDYVAAAAERVGQMNSEASFEGYANALVSVAVFFNKSAENQPADSKKAWAVRSIELLKASIDLEYQGATPKATKMYWLASSYVKAEEKVAAAETYGRIAEMAQDDLSPLWMRQLQAEQQHGFGTLEFCNALEEVLVEYVKSGRADEHEVTFRHLLGKSYSECGMFDKSSKVLSALVGKSNDDNMNAYNLFLAAENHVKLAQYETAADLFEQVVRLYPNSGSAKLAELALANARKALLAEQLIRQNAEIKAASSGAAFSVILVINGIVVVCLAAFFLLRRRNKLQ